MNTMTISKADLKKIRRFDIDASDNGEFVQLERRNELEGTFVEWSEIEKLFVFNRKNKLKNR